MHHVPYWNIQGGLLIDLVALVGVAVFCYGIYLHWLRIQTGQATYRFDFSELKASIMRGIKKANSRRFFINGLLGSRVYQDTFIGISHGMVFWGMFCLLIGTTLVVLNVWFGLPVMSGAFYTWGMAFGLDLAGLSLLLGLLFLMIRRLGGYQRLTTPKSRPGFVVAELFLLAIVITGFILEGLRILTLGASEPAFMGHLFAFLLGSLGDNAPTIHQWLWWLHGIAAMVFIAYIPFSPLVHMVLVPVNATLADPYMGVDTEPLDMESMDFEEVEDEADMPRMGAAAIADFAAERRLDFATCLWCGRCQEVCPASRTEKSLSPKGIINTLAEYLQQEDAEDDSLIDTLSQETLFECRTCGACAEVCPAHINPIKSIWQMRRHLVMDRGEMPDEVVQVCRNLEAMNHPFSSSSSPSEWRKGLDVPVFENNTTEYLLWVGCAITYEDRAQSVGRAMVNILNSCGLSYGILEEARCTGDPAKQLGDDYLFSMMAEANIELFKEMGVTKIITMCPHCYNSFKNFYPPMGGDFEIIPHTELLKELIGAEKIKLSNTGKKATYHDPCYLGRHNRFFSSPRDIIGKVAGLEEMQDSKENSFCCGAGGGNYWNEEEGERINQVRAKQAFDIDSDTLVSSCPFCLLMLTDGMKNFSDQTQVIDIAELVEKNLIMQ